MLLLKHNNSFIKHISITNKCQSVQYNKKKISNKTHEIKVKIAKEVVKEQNQIKKKNQPEKALHSLANTHKHTTVFTQI